jgi:hypothetical protein
MALICCTLPPSSAENERGSSRYTAEAVKSALLRHDLLEIAKQFDELADSIEEERFSG